MNKVFYGLSIGLIGFAGWFIYKIELWLVLLFVGIAIILMSGALHVINPLVRTLRLSFGNLNLRDDVNGHIVFAPIDNPIARVLSEQITSSMTLTDIDKLVARTGTGSLEIHNLSTTIER